MPPRRSARAVSGASAVSAPVPAVTTKRAPARSRKQPVPSPAPSDDSILGDHGDAVQTETAEPFPGEEDEDEVEIPMPKAKGRRGAAKSRPVPVAAPAKRRGKRVSQDSLLDDEEDANEDEVQDTRIEEPEPAKTSSRAVKSAPVRGRKKAVESSDEEAEDLMADLPKTSRTTSISQAAGTSKSRTTPSIAQPVTSEAPQEQEDDEEQLEEQEDAEEGTKVETKEEEDGEDGEDEDDADATITLDAPPQLGSEASTSPTTPFAPRVVPIPIATPASPPPPSGPKARLTIHKLVLVNFKSYAGRQEIGPFHKSFSAIVGPNGSGKSNTIDALLFVFGYRASKMRQGKLSELIHNSAGKEGLESCSVEVWFREIVDQPGVDNFLLVPNSQLVVTRTAFRNNSSKYTINDRSSSFTEVTTLLKGKGIDLDHNRFLILQGEVESIAQMKAKAQNEHEDGLLEYLEDIIGTTRYKQPIEEASLEVEALNEQRGEKMNRLRVVEREKAALVDKKREADDYIRDQNELTRKKSLLWQFFTYTLTNNLEITSKAVESLTAQLVEEQERNKHHLAEIDDLQKGYDEKLAAFQEVKRLTDALVKDSKKYEKEEVGLQEKKKHLSTKQRKIKKSLTDDGHARSEAASSIENYSAELETNRKKVANLESKLETEEAELEEIRDSLKDKTDEFTTKIEAKQRELEPWTAKISEKQSAIDIATSERDLLVQKATGAQTALEEAKVGLETLREGDGSKQEEYAGLKKEAGKVKKQLAEAEARLEAMVANGEALRAKVSQTRSKTDEAKASLAADKSENAVLGSLNKLKAQGRIKGFHGRLGDLGVIDDKYDVAVTTACGALNNLVVDTVEQGQACIEHLRKGNVGRASFMVLEKLPPRDLGRIETPENVPRLFDLIKPKDPRFAPAFYKGVFNTLVAEDLVQAQRIGYGKKRWRVVTLAGQLIDPSGTMSGGGTKVSRGGMSSKFAADQVAPEVVARYEQESAQAEANFANFQSERRAVESEVAALRKRLPEIEIAMEKIELDVQTGAKRIAEAERRLKELLAQSKPDAADEKRIKVLESEISSLTKETDKLREKSSSITEQIKELQNKILEVGGVRLRAINSKVTTTRGLLDLANEAITRSEVGQAKAERDVEKLSKTIESDKAKLAEVDAELEIVEGDLVACTADLNVIKEKVQEAMDASTDVQDALAESKTELDEKLEGINGFRALEMDIKQKIEDNARIQKDSKDKLKHWRKRHDELRLEQVDEDDDEEDEAGDAAAGATPAQNSSASRHKPTSAEEDEEEPSHEVEAEAETNTEAGPSKRKHHDPLELIEYSADELRSVDKDLLNAEIVQLEEELAKARPNLAVLKEWKKREAEFLNRATDMERVTNQRDAAKKRYDDLRKVRLDEFMAGFTAISAKLKEMYQMITMGGNAEIELIDSMDPFSEGVVLSIMPPKKSWRAIANLSGGEKTLASLALVFALHVFKPTPLYFMDEIDAALDFKNVSIVANYIQSKTQAAQFIVISLRNDMFELAHRLVGIYKTSNCTKSIAIDNKDLRTQAVSSSKAQHNVGSGGAKASSAAVSTTADERRGTILAEQQRRQSVATVSA